MTERTPSGVGDPVARLIDVMERRFDDMQTEVKKIGERLEKVHESNTNLETKFGLLEQSLNHREEVISEMRTDLRTVRETSLPEMKKELEEQIKREVGTLQKKHDAAVDRVTALEKSDEAQKEQLENLKWITRLAVGAAILGLISAIYANIAG